MKFVDEVTVKVAGGNGGNGVVTWRREKFVPEGGPDGGDGGSGGAVIFKADSGLNTLIDFSFKPHLEAEDGEAGSSGNKNGKDGKNLVCRVPVGTQVFFEGRLVADISHPQARWVAAKGGHGGKGNAFFKSSTNQAPDFAQPGQKGQAYQFLLSLKSVADVGIIGLPNVGKSTLIAAISAAFPKIADYPFTTIKPNLGVVTLSGERRFVAADIPGLIPGAHQGKGLGIRFLKHIERTKVLAHLIDISGSYFSLEDSIVENLEENKELITEAVIKQFQAIDDELRFFSEDLAKLPRLIVFSKADFPFTKEVFELTKGFFIERNFDVIMISAREKLNVEELKEKLYLLLTVK